MMDSELGAWLRQQREDRGWDKREMARRLVDAGRAAGDTAMPAVDGMHHNLHRWEYDGGVSERHKLHYCRVLGIHPSRFGPHPPRGTDRHRERSGNDPDHAMARGGGAGSGFHCWLVSLRPASIQRLRLP